MKTKQDEPMVKLFMLKARDVQEPPFFHTGVPAMVLVAAKDEGEARRLAAGAMPTSENAWLDDGLVTCEEYRAKESGFVASA